MNEEEQSQSVPSPFEEEPTAAPSGDETAPEPEAPTQEARPRPQPVRGEHGVPSGTLIGGAVMIVLGLVLLLRDLGITSVALDNWWALFILIPAVGAFSRAWNAYQVHDRLTPYARRSLMTGCILIVVIVVFLFDIDWRFALPVLLILAGIGALIGVIGE